VEKRKNYDRMFIFLVLLYKKNHKNNVIILFKYYIQYYIQYYKSCEYTYAMLIIFLDVKHVLLIENDITERN